MAVASMCSDQVWANEWMGTWHIHDKDWKLVCISVFVTLKKVIEVWESDGRTWRRTWGTAYNDDGVEWELFLIETVFADHQLTVFEEWRA